MRKVLFFVVVLAAVFWVLYSEPPPSSSRKPATNRPSSSTSPANQAINRVSAYIAPNKLNVTASDLRAKENPKGEGVFVYVPKTRFRGVERLVIWMVVDGTAYALNSPSKMVTPTLSWPREAPPNTWKKTGFGRHMVTKEAIDIVFGQ